MVSHTGRTEDLALRESVDAIMRPLMATHAVPGMAVAVIVDGQVSFHNYGLASLEGRITVSEDTLFELGSVSKVFAATLATYAEAQGKLSLADHPGKAMPQLRGSAIDGASLLELGTFTAGGLPLQFPGTVHDNESMVRYFRGWKPDAIPGAVRRYSNPSIGLLGYIAALALGRDYVALMENDLFPRLGMRHSYIRVPANAIKEYAWGYRDGRALRVNPGQLDAQAYGVKSSARDLIRFVSMNIDPASLEAPLRQAVQATHIGYFKIGEMVQGLGWEQYPFPVSLSTLKNGNSTHMSMLPNPAVVVRPAAQDGGQVLFNKTGSTNGFGAYVAFIPARKTGVVILANKNFPVEARILAAHAILQRALR